MKEYDSHSLAETDTIAAEWLANVASLVPGHDRAVVVGLSGHLGAGKTAFVKSVARLMQVQEEVASPTFVIMKRYVTGHPRWKYLVHIDAYRLEHAHEFEAVRFDDLRANPDNLIMVEWPENVDLAADQTISFEQKNISPQSFVIHLRVS